MPHFVVYIDKTITAQILVEANSIEEAYNAETSLDKIIDVHDCGWDVVWQVDELSEHYDNVSNVTFLTQEDLLKTRFVP
jgi:hypothetical protein